MSAHRGAAGNRFVFCFFPPSLSKQFQLSQHATENIRCERCSSATFMSFPSPRVEMKRLFWQRRKKNGTQSSHVMIRQLRPSREPVP